MVDLEGGRQMRGTEYFICSFLLGACASAPDRAAGGVLAGDGRPDADAGIEASSVTGDDASTSAPGRDASPAVSDASLNPPPPDGSIDAVGPLPEGGAADGAADDAVADGAVDGDADGSINAWQPVVKGPWRVLFEPTVPGPGHYMNDHTVIKGHDGKWHIIGINGGGSGREVSFAHAIADSIDPPTNVVQQPPLAQYVDPNGKPLEAWAPYAMDVGGTIYLFYRSNVGLALDVSADPNLRTWQRRTDIVADHVDVPNCYRDPMVLPLGNTYVMYAPRLINGRTTIMYFESTDLIHWTSRTPVLTTSGTVVNPPWCSTESPFVFKRGAYYYLSSTVTDSGQATYHDTIIVRSTDPLSFGDYNGGSTTSTGNPVTKIVAHAPEYVHDLSTDRWFITTCGWENRSVYPEAKHGVAIAELVFQ
jgi:hypothetical protein